MKRILLLPVTSTLVVLLGAGLLLPSNLYTFYRLTDESPIAELRFVSSAPGEYQALLLYGDFCEPQRYTLYGDQWRLDAMFLKWRAWANLLGMDSLYRIERLGGRYSEVSAENAATAHAYELQDDSPVDLAGMLARYKGVISPVDTLYGSSVYADMDPAFIYHVYRGQSGLLVRKVTTADSPASDGTLTIDINRSCGGSPGLLERAGGYTDRLVRRISG